jgi:peptidoglycan/LPS O-acetylase OafA/YrhL
LVVVCHLLWHPDFLSVRQVYAKWVAPLGPLGVRVFFVISGFLITSLLLREVDRSEHIHLAKFYLRRTLRIFPPYYVFLLAVILLQVVGSIELAPADTLHAFTYTVNYYPERSWYLGHAWSLSVEEQFYLLWPLTLLLAGKRRALWIAASTVILCPMIRLGIWYLSPALVKYELGYRFETTVDALAVGCVLAGVSEWLRLQQLYHQVLQSRLFVLVPLVVLSASLLPPSSRLNLIWGITAQNIGIAACIAWCTTHYASNVGKVLNSKPMVFLGILSYSIYLWQQLFLNPYSLSMVTRFPLNLILVGMASLASYYCIEHPSLIIRQRLENKFLAHNKGHGAQAVQGILNHES